MDGKILIIDDVATNRIVFKVKLGAAQYQPLMAAGGIEGLALARRERPQLILMDLSLRDLSGIEVLHALREAPATRDIPVIAISSGPATEDRLAALAAGADDVFVKPYDDDLMMARLRNLLRTRQELADLTAGPGDAIMFGMAEAEAEFRAASTLMFVSDRPEITVKLRHDLAPMIRDTIHLATHHTALNDLEPGRNAPDLYVIDAGGDQSERALRLLSSLRSRAITRHAGICLLTSAVARADGAIGYDLGANAILSPEMGAMEIVLRLRAVLRRKRWSDLRREQVQDGLRLAIIDPLTGLFNRRYAAARLLSMADEARAKGATFAILVADIDRFKAVNDQHGHAAGDEVLAEISQRLGHGLRSTDLLARIGGEEFLIAIPATTLEEARMIATRLCRSIDERPVRLPAGQTLNMTLSIGVTLSDDLPCFARMRAPDLVDALIDRADRALLVSKKAGRNQVTLARTAA